MTDNYSEAYAEDARLTILKELMEETSRTLNETALRRALKTYGFRRDRNWVREQLTVMEGLGAITITRAGSVFIAVLTRTGQDHVEQDTVIKGITVPSQE